MFSALAKGRWSPTGWWLAVAVPSWIGRPLAVFLLARVLITYVALTANVMLRPGDAAGIGRVLPQSLLLDAWLRWDAIGYLELADGGYWLDRATGASSAPLSPLLPILARFASTVTGDTAVAGIAVANVALVVGLVLLYRQVASRYGEATATKASVLVVLSPFAFVLYAGYPQSLVLLLAITSLWPAGQRAVWWQITCAAVAPLASPLGLALWPALAFRLPVRKEIKSGLPLLILPLPLAAAAVGLAQTGLPQEVVMRSLFGASPGSPLVWALSGASGWVAPSMDGLRLAVNLAAYAFALIAIVPTRRLVGLPAAAMLVSLVVLGTLLYPGQPAHWLPLALPAFVVVAHYLRSEVGETAVIATSAALLGLATAGFASWNDVGVGTGLPKAPATPDRLMAAYSARGELPSQAVGYSVGGDLLVLGYGKPLGDGAPGSTLQTDIYLHRLRATDVNYLLSVHLRDAEGGRWGVAQELVGGQLATPRLDQGDSTRHQLRMSIDPQTPSGLYALEASALIVPPFSTQYERPEIRDTSNRKAELPVIGELLVARPGDVLPVAEARPRWPVRASLGDEIELLGYDLDYGGDQTQPNARAALYWTARRQPASDYTVFLQALDGAGKVVAQSDGYPWAGRLPTSRMTPGTVIRDERTLALSPGTDRTALRLIVGMYKLETMRRLPVVGPDGAVQGDYVVLGK